MIWIRPTLCDDGLLNGVYFLDPYGSVPVVPIKPLAYFPRCARARAVQASGHPIGGEFWLVPAKMRIVFTACYLAKLFLPSQTTRVSNPLLD